MPAGMSPSRPRLSRESVLRGAVAVADAGGIGSLTMRSLADALEVKPMSIYHHVANKDDVLDGIVDIVFSEIDLPVIGGDWHAEMRRRASSAREAMRRHPWAIGLVETRTSPGPATLKHHNAVIGTLRQAGFSVEMTAHAFALIDAYVYGFALSEATLPVNGPETVTEVAGRMMDQYSPGDYPHLVEFTVEHVMKPGYNYGAEFEFGLDLVLDGLARSLQHAESARNTWSD
ncbi:TetR/AcrR family transcriptional regulator [Arthrobacter sp. Leaf69]|uniref:TetR/AcrR family transcriptional regulator n=1 Tax=Arthrobacter sp. Leaf69 TaxID=1736232 RepID=UPI0006FE8CD6|nr:TetR/AcrR family transcriptional regulator [Arthrobacter sp. Leaf69]KQN89386.1 AcrR family transcriptional regulator [Arthrobacter sp. Leaf69]